MENRVRLVRELIEETKDAVGDTCAVAVRMAADDGTGTPEQPVSEERREMFSILAELPDLWDVNIHNYEHEMGVSRFVKEGIPRKGDALRQIDHQQTGGNRRAIYLSGRHGLADTPGYRGFYWRGPPFHCRPVLAAQNRRRPSRGRHSRVYRLQYLLHRR